MPSTAVGIKRPPLHDRTYCSKKKVLVIIITIRVIKKVLIGAFKNLNALIMCEEMSLILI